MRAAADFSPALRTRLLVLQGTPFCNIACTYCYLPGRDRHERMSPDTVHRVAQRLRDDGLAGAELSVVWHAGEPLVLAPSFYDEAFAALAEPLSPQTRVTHAVQTNAMLIDDDWCRLFRRHAVSVGVSVDGPQVLHDAHRRSRSGQATHAAVMRGIDRLRAHGLRFHAIAVVTGSTLADPDAFFDWFAAHGIRELGCNFDEAEGGHRRSSLAGREAAHRAFLERLLERSVASGGQVVIRELAQAWQRIAEPLPQVRHGGRNWPDNAQVLPLALLSVASNGDFSTFSPELLGQPWPAYDDFVLGNVHRGGFLESLGGDAFARLWRDVRAGVDACARTCAHFDYCGGGAPVNKLYEHGDLGATETLYCRSMIQRPFEVVLRRLERELAPQLEVATP
jgi:uncharacterized protein